MSFDEYLDNHPMNPANQKDLKPVRACISPDEILESLKQVDEWMDYNDAINAAQKLANALNISIRVFPYDEEDCEMEPETVSPKGVK